MIPASSLARVDAGSRLRVQAFWQPLPTDLAQGLLASARLRRLGRGAWLRAKDLRLLRRIP